MSSFQRFQAIGYMGQDPDMRFLPTDGSPVVNISVATTERWVDKKTGAEQERTEWHRCVAFGRRAEVIGEYARKGSEVFVEGRARTRKWTDDKGSDHYTTEFVLSNFQFLGKRTDSTAAVAAAQAVPTDVTDTDNVPQGYDDIPLPTEADIPQ